MDSQLSIIFPCYNEEESVARVLNESLILLEKHKNIEILVVDDGSIDGTVEELKKFEGHIRLIQHEKNMGYGAAIKTGLFYSKGDIISFMDFDGTCVASQALDMLNALYIANADIVMGVRLHEKSKMPKTRWIGNQLYRGLLKSLYPSHELPQDVCTGFRLLKRSVAEDLFLDLPNDLSFSPALTARALKRNYRIINHKITYRERFGHSKISLLKDGLKFSKALFVERFL